MPDGAVISEADNERINAALTIAARICRKYAGPGVEYSDLFSIALEAVALCWDDSGERENFELRAAWRVKRRILDQLRKHRRELNATAPTQARKRVPSKDPTHREMQVWEASTEGLKRPQIAERLGITVRTVDAHLQSLRKRLGVYGNAAALGRMWAERQARASAETIP